MTRSRRTGRGSSAIPVHRLPNGGGHMEGGDPAGGALDQVLASVEKREILTALRRADGRRTEAARLLGISRSRLYRRMDALGINPGEPEPIESL
ncbi:MAG: hypothetical protein HY763_13900 [Planctomycetes bacterium]|nr:hypothetical protein [Planctomycetota bacterium]